MNAKSKRTPSFLFAQRQTEDRQLGEYVQELQAWLKEVNDIGIPRFGARGVGTLMVLDDDSKPIGILNDRDLAVRIDRGRTQASGRNSYS